MENKKWVMFEELEKLTTENAANFISPSMYGQVKIKGKYIRDENGKLVPVLVKMKRQVTPFKEGRCIRTDKEKSRGFSILKGLKKLVSSILGGRYDPDI